MLLWDGGVRTGKIDAHKFVEITSTNPARMFGLWPKKGTVAVSSDGDLVLWDPDKEVTLSAKTHHMRVDYGRDVLNGWFGFDRLDGGPEDDFCFLGEDYSDCEFTLP